MLQGLSQFWVSQGFPVIAWSIPESGREGDLCAAVEISVRTGRLVLMGCDHDWNEQKSCSLTHAVIGDGRVKWHMVCLRTVEKLEHGEVQKGLSFKETKHIYKTSTDMKRISLFISLGSNLNTLSSLVLESGVCSVYRNEHLYRTGFI